MSFRYVSRNRLSEETFSLLLFLSVGGTFNQFDGVPEMTVYFFPSCQASVAEEGTANEGISEVYQLCPFDQMKFTPRLSIVFQNSFCSDRFTLKKEWKI
jgi:hypothetical protein